MCPCQSPPGICRERTNLKEQLKDSKSVVGTLRWLLGLILHIIFIFFYLLIFNVGTRFL